MCEYPGICSWIERKYPLTPSREGVGRARFLSVNAPGPIILRANRPGWTTRLSQSAGPLRRAGLAPENQARPWRVGVFAEESKARSTWFYFTMAAFDLALSRTTEDLAKSGRINADF